MDAAKVVTEPGVDEGKTATGYRDDLDHVHKLITCVDKKELK